MGTFYGVWGLFLGRVGGIASGVPGGPLMGAGGPLGAEEKEGGGKGGEGGCLHPLPVPSFPPTPPLFLPFSLTFRRISELPRTPETILKAQEILGSRFWSVRPKWVLVTEYGVCSWGVWVVLLRVFPAEL